MISSWKLSIDIPDVSEDDSLSSRKAIQLFPIQSPLHTFPRHNNPSLFRKHSLKVPQAHVVKFSIYITPNSCFVLVPSCEQRLFLSAPNVALTISGVSFNVKCHTWKCYMTQQPLGGQGLLLIEASRSHSDTPQSVWLLWTSDQPDAQISTWQHTTPTRDRHPWPRRYSNPQSQQAGCRKPTT
jgi:hypothetical protein